jgi:hypothetical protein
MNRILDDATEKLSDKQWLEKIIAECKSRNEAFTSYIAKIHDAIATITDEKEKESYIQMEKSFSYHREIALRQQVLLATKSDILQVEYYKEANSAALLSRQIDKFRESREKSYKYNAKEVAQYHAKIADIAKNTTLDASVYGISLRDRVDIFLQVAKDEGFKDTEKVLEDILSDDEGIANPQTPLLLTGFGGIGSYFGSLFSWGSEDVSHSAEVVSDSDSIF